MGKAVPKGIKSKSNLLVAKFADRFSPDFVQNKDFIKTLELPFSKKERNLMAGFITRKMKQLKQAA